MAKAARAREAERKIAVGRFKTHCLGLMDEVQRTRQPVVITKRGKPVARLVPIEEKPRSLYGALKGAVTVKGDIVSPLYPEWREPF